MNRSNFDRVVRVLVRIVAVVCVGFGMLHGGCARSTATTFREASDPSPSWGAPLMVPACDNDAPPGRCFPGRLTSAPVIVGPGRVRALLQPSSIDTSQPGFVVREVSDHDYRSFSEGECPSSASLPQSLALLDSGRTGIVCAGSDGLFFGEIAPGGGAVQWRWQERLRHPNGVPPGNVPYFAELGGKIVLIYTMGHLKGGPSAAPYAIQVVPGSADYRPLCDGDRCAEKIVALLLAKGVLHVLWTSAFLESKGQYGDLTLTDDGELHGGEVTPSVRSMLGPMFDPRDRIAPCVAQGRDGAVTVSLPGVGTQRYEKAFLPQGPDVYPAEEARCAPAHFDDPTPPRLPREFRRGIRATLGSSWVVVYGLDPHGGLGAQHVYLGSLRVLAWPKSH